MNVDKEKQAIQHLQTFEPKNEPYLLGYSGGKDSDVILTLAKLAGVKYEAVHNLTTVDAPETVYYVRSQPDIKIDVPDTTMWKLIVQKKMPPTRFVRYCCSELKERGGKFRKKVLGVRWAESSNRKKNGGLVKILGKEKTMQKLAEEAGLDYDTNPKGGMILNDDNDENRLFVEHCYRTTTTMINPIVDWTDTDVWEFLHYYGIKGNPLYDVSDRGGTYCPMGRKRIGCIACPMQNSKGMKRDLIRYPKYRDNYLRAFDRMLRAREEAGLSTDRWHDAESVMMWWVGDDPNQMSLFGTPDYLK